MSTPRLLITGSRGLIGTAITKRLNEGHISTLGIDLRERSASHRFDVRDAKRLIPLLDGVTGVIHLAAVSRVITGEQDPELCQAVNVAATQGIVDAALRASPSPWVIYASSREVYGVQESQPVAEDADLRPVNVYARTKVAAERCVNSAREAGLQTAIVRFSNVYGSIDDHADRVVPAFAAAAVRGGTLRVDGKDCSFDLTHIDDVSLGLLRVVEALTGGEKSLPPIHFVSGKATTLLGLAQQVNGMADNRGQIVEAKSRTFDVHRFVGSPQRAFDILGWRASTSLQEGLSRLIRDFAQCAA